MLKISGLYIYPVKSLAGIPVIEARITPKGFEHDRRWMLVDENNRFVSQREIAEMTLLQPGLTDEGIIITHKTIKDSIIIPFKPPENCIKLVVTIWGDTCIAEHISDEADKWFTKMLGTPCRLVYMPDSTKRQVEEEFAPVGAETSFSDAYPYLLIGQSSLDDLNNRLTAPVLINRFRPNIVFTGGGPFAEDGFDHFTIGKSHFHGAKLCARCQVVSINQENGLKAKEPFKTLAAYRLRGNKIYFGQNLLGPYNGITRLGDELNVLKYHTEERFKILLVGEKLPVADIGKPINTIASQTV